MSVWCHSNGSHTDQACIPPAGIAAIWYYCMLVQCYKTYIIYTLCKYTVCLYSKSYIMWAYYFIANEDFIAERKET